MDTDSYRPGHSQRPPSEDATRAVTALYEAHAVGMIRIALLMLGDRAAAAIDLPAPPSAEAAALLSEDRRRILAGLRLLPGRLA